MIKTRSRDSPSPLLVIVFKSLSLFGNDCIPWWLISRTDIEPTFVFTCLLRVILARSRELLGRVIKHRCIWCRWPHRVLSITFLYEFNLGLVSWWPWYALLPRGVLFDIYSLKFVSGDPEREGLDHTRWGNRVFLRAWCNRLVNHVCKSLTVPNASSSLWLRSRDHIEGVAAINTQLFIIFVLTRLWSWSWNASICQN